MIGAAQVCHLYLQRPNRLSKVTLSRIESSDARQE